MNTIHAAKREDLDQYFTPPWATKTLLHYADDITGPVGEPCAGAGHIVKTLQEVGLETVSGDFDDKIEPLDPDLGIEYGGDFFHTKTRQRYSGLPWIITNPPYRIGSITAADFFRQARRLAKYGVAMLMRIAWIEACKDREDLLEDLSEVLVLANPRLQFLNTGKRNPSQSAWFIWRAGDEGKDTRIRWAEKSVCNSFRE